MRSAAESLRRARRVELLARGIGLAAVAAAIVIAFVQSRRSDGRAAAVHLDVDGAASAVVRDSVAALWRAGRAVTWSGDLSAVMAVAEPLREPVAGWRVAVVGDARVRLRDSLDVLDSLDASGVLTTEPTRGPVQALDGATVAMAAAASVGAPPAVFVYGRVGWEPRFAIAALEEIGWTVDARLELGRERSVRQGVATPARARHGVVVVFDSASARREAATLQRFLRAGGGVVLAGSAGGSRALPPRGDSLLIALGDSAVVVRAARVGRGRVLSVDEAETWRWRMQGEGSAVEAHRAFWSRLVGVAAPALAESSAAASSGTAPGIAAAAAAPRAALVHALGPERPQPRRAAELPTGLPWWLAPLVLLALFTEWASRRRRGVP